MSKKILIIIPAYNEEKSIEKVLTSVKKEVPGCDVLVINDGSKDKTASVAQNCRANVVSVPYNLGIGGAVQTGLLYAQIKKYDIAIQLDADGQHKANEIEKLLAALKKNEADMVLGSRFLHKTNYHSSFMRKLGNIIFSGLIAMVTKQRFSDSTSGFRAWNRQAINFLSSNYPTEFP